MKVTPSIIRAFAKETAALAAEVTRRLRYDAETGKLFWRGSFTSRAQMNHEAGRNQSVYRKVTVAGTQVFSHRLAWLLHYGEWPAGEVDHINGDKRDNRIANLRVVSHATNLRNRSPKARKNRNGFMGVVQHRLTGRWYGRIQVNGKTRSLGTFATPEEASAAYQAAVAEHV